MRTGRVADAVAAFASNARNPELRPAQLAFGLMWASEWAFLIGLSVVAFRAGGAEAVGIVAAVRMIPAGVLAPFATVLADRFPRDRVLVVSCAARGIAVAAAAALSHEPWAVYALAVLATAAFTVLRPAHSALMPALCRTPAELAAASVVRGLMDSGGTLVGPAVAALLLAVAGPGAVFAAVAAASLAAAALILRISYDPPARAPAPERRLLRELAEGLAALRRRPDAGLVLGVAVAQAFTRGCFNVLVVVLALDVLDAGESAVGVLTSAIGLGAVLGSLGAGLLADGRNLARWEGVGAALWGLPLVAVAAVPEPGAAFAFLAVIGIGNALVDVGLFTLPVRLVPDAYLGRVFGVFESLGALAVAAGALLTPVAVDALGDRGALVAAGLVGPVVVAASWFRLRHIDRAMGARDGEVALLRRVPLLRPLTVPAIEELAVRARAEAVADGATVFAAGDEGDAFYVVAEGAAEVRQDGTSIRRLGPGDGFGEIALLREVRRTATVVSAGGLVVRVIAREAFLAAVTGHRPTSAAANEVVSDLLTSDERRAAEGAG